MAETEIDDRLAKAAAIVVTKAFSLLPTYALEGLVAGEEKAIEALQASARAVLVIREEAKLAEKS